jgi:hypothetical protein
MSCIDKNKGNPAATKRTRDVNEAYALIQSERDNPPREMRPKEDEGGIFFDDTPVWGKDCLAWAMDSQAPFHLAPRLTLSGRHAGSALQR